MRVRGVVSLVSFVPIVSLAPALSLVACGGLSRIEPDRLSAREGEPASIAAPAPLVASPPSPPPRRAEIAAAEPHAPTPAEASAIDDINDTAVYPTPDEAIAYSSADLEINEPDEPNKPNAPNEPDEPDEPDEPTAPEPADESDKPRDVDEIASIAKETWIYTEPRWSSRRLGYLRAGAILERSAKPAGFASCPDGWYRVAPNGYVCAGAGATLDIHDPVVETSRRRPNLEGLPYTYVMSRSPPPPRYARLPTLEEQRRAEPDLPGHLRSAARFALDPAYVAPPPADPTPGVLLYDRPAPGLRGASRSPDALFLGSARPRSAFALLSTFDHDGRRFGMTTELEVIPIDRTRVVQQSSFSGLALRDDITLPIAFVRSRRALRYAPGPGGGFVPSSPLPYRAAVPLATLPSGGSAAQTLGSVTYLKTTDGSFVRADQVVRVDRPRNLPAWASSGRSGRKWIDVSILHQTLVAYEGTKPVYATLVSTGADGLGDPQKTHSTIQGTFLIHTKHVTVTMDGENGEEFDFRDVPFVQFFNEGFALHAAYWHDDFGTPRSHGCINLAPIDAAWLFGWTTPDVPSGWHAALSLKKGTLVYTHP
jgi:lipoprotein-anchoring transpeptidase ErfK/SrfK